MVDVQKDKIDSPDQGTQASKPLQSVTSPPVNEESSSSTPRRIFKKVIRAKQHTQADTQGDSADNLEQSKSQAIAEEEEVILVRVRR